VNVVYSRSLVHAVLVGGPGVSEGVAVRDGDAFRDRLAVADSVMESVGSAVEDAVCVADAVALTMSARCGANADATKYVPAGADANCATVPR
jgi:hypothetical protein